MLLAPNQFSTELSNATSTGTLLGGSLTFSASYWRVKNDGTVPVRFTLNSTSPSTNDYEIRPGSLEEFQNVPASSKFGLMTTSTSTSLADHRRVAVLALGG